MNPNSTSVILLFCLLFSCSQAPTVIGGNKPGDTSTEAPTPKMMIAPDEMKPAVLMTQGGSVSVNASCFRQSVTEIEFGVSQLGCNTEVKRVSLLNACQNEIKISRLNFSDTSFGSDALRNVSASHPIVIAPNDYVDVRVSYQPDHAGKHHGTLEIESSDTTAPLRTVELSGFSTSTRAKSTLSSVETGPIDILFVIDDSCSMADAQQKFAASLDVLFNNDSLFAFSDFHIAAITTDTNRQGQFLGANTSEDPLVLTPLTANYRQVLKRRVEKLPIGSADEMIAENIKNALSNVKQRADFLRPNIPLRVVAVTDAADNSPNAVSTYVDVPKPYKFHYIGGTLPQAPKGCFYDLATLNTFLKEFSELTQGQRFEICAPDFDDAMADIADEVLGAAPITTHSFRMIAGLPNLKTPDMTVLVDGASVPSTDAMGAIVWNYIADRREVRFEPKFLPAETSRVVAEFNTQCK